MLLRGAFRTQDVVLFDRRDTAAITDDFVSANRVECTENRGETQTRAENLKVRKNNTELMTKKKKNTE